MNKITKNLLKENNRREKELYDENQEIYTDMIVYLRTSNLSEYNQELVRGDIIELILEGQQRGDNIEEVMGGNYKEVCDEIINAMPKMTKKEKIKEFMVIILNSIWILGIIAIVKSLIINIASDNSIYKFTLTIGDTISFIVIVLLSYFIVWYISKTALNEEETNKKISFLKTWLILMVIFGLLILSSIYLDTIILKIHLLTSIIIVILIFVMSKIIN